MAPPLVIVVPDPALVVLVGAAGAGKSTFATRHFAPDEILSSDAFRARIAGDPGDQRATGQAFGALHRALTRRLDAGRLTVVDATSVQAHARRSLLRRAALARVPSIAIVLDLPRDIVLARNAARGPSAVPQPSVIAQLDDLAASIAHGPAAWDGFASVIRLSSAADVDRVRIERASPEGPRPASA